MATTNRSLLAKAITPDAGAPSVDWAALLAPDSGSQSAQSAPAAPPGAQQIAPPQDISVAVANPSAAFTAGALTYTENFNSLVSTGTGTGNAYEGGTLLGSTAFVFTETGGTGTTTYTAGTGSSNTADTYSFGTAGSSDRAIGSLASGTVTNSYYGILFTNNTGSTITSLAIAYTGELWRVGGRTVANGPDKLDFQYSLTATTIGATTGYTDYDALDFISPAALPSVATGAGGGDGNAAANRTALSSNLSVSIAAGGTIFLRWVDSNAIGSDDGLAIDDFSVTATTASAVQPGSLAIGSVSHAEGNSGQTDYVFTVTRSGGSSGAVSAAYSFAAGSTNAADFLGGAFPAGGTVSFADGETSKQITVSVAGDTLYEGTETFSLGLSAPTGGATIGTATGTGTITNDDTAPTLAIDSVTQNEGDAGTTAFTFTVTLSGATALTTSVDYSVANGTTNMTDFVGAFPSGTLIFAPGTTTQTVTVNVQGDATFEPSETFTVTLANPTNATIATATGTGTITNDDAAPANGTLAIDSVTHAEGNGGTTDYVFTVSRTGGSAGAVTADYTFAAGTTDATDFAGGVLPANGTVSFGDGETSKTITVSVAGDALYENNESFSLALGNPGGGVTITGATSTGTITNDDTAPSLSISSPSVTEGNSGTTLLTYVVTASAASALPITFDIATGGGTATAGSDYTAQTITGATIAAGQTSYSFSVVVNGDTVAEANETVQVTLSNPSGATIATAQGVGTIGNDDGTPATALIFSENFDGFTAAGFASTPGAGQLDSDIWRVVGLSDIANPAYGFTGPAGGDFGRGLINGTDVVAAGVYSPSASNGALIVQPTGAELDVNGFIEARLQNTSGFTASGFDVAFDWAYRNNATRGDNLQLSYSTDGTNFTAAPAANFSTPTAVDAVGFTTAHEAVSLTNLFVGDGGYLTLRFTHTGSTGSGSRDEVGIDNLVVNAGLTSATVATVNSISVAEGNSGTTPFSFTITRSGGAGSASVDYTTTNGTATAGSDYTATSGTVNFVDGQTTATVTVQVNGDTANEANETFYLDLSNPVNLQLPATRGTATITNDDTGAIGIYDIQGHGITSPLVGQTVATGGVVTAVDSNGFYLQDPTGDGDIGTSDAILVFTGTAPTVVVGNQITLTGTVTEFTGTTAGSASLTELNSPTNIVVVNASVALPAAVLISTDGTGRAPPTSVIDSPGYNPTTDGFDFYESLEGMRVTVQAPRVVSNTNGFGETFVVASNGVSDTGLNSRSGNTISAGDNNPETLVITRDAGIYSSYAPNHSQGDTLSDVTGVLTYQFAQYELIVTVPVTTANHVTLTREKTTLVGDANHLSYATFNVENLAPVPDSSVPARDTQAKVDAAFAAHGNEIVTALKNPDIIGVQEIQDADGIGTGTDHSGTATANKLIAAIVAAGGPTYKFVEVAPTDGQSTGGEPNGYIHNGYLYNPERVSFAGSATLLNDAAYSGSRRPLLADFTFNGQTFTAADLHSTSRGGSDPLFGAHQPPTQAGDAARTAQGQALQTYISGVQGSDPSHQFIVNGDFNGYYYEGGLLALESSATQAGGTGSLTNLISTLLPPEERYSYYFGGYYQLFDNILVSANLAPNAQVDVVHYNAGFTDGLSATDHDQTVAIIDFTRAGAAVAVANADAIATGEAAQVRGSVLTNDSGGAGTMVTALNGAATLGTPVRLASGALLTLNADGSYVYNPDGAYSALNTGESATDSFTYAITGGSTATATVTISGMTNAAPTAGNDVESGTTGGDAFDLSAGGDDIVSTGQGNDTAYFAAAFTAQDRVDGGSGNDQIGLQGDYTGPNKLVLNANTVSNVETIAALPGFSYDITSNDANVAAGQTMAIYGSTLASGNNLTFDGSAETDGKFVVYGGLGIDTITTGAGADAIYFGRGGRFGAGDHVDGGAGTDQLALDGSYTVTISGTQVVNVEVLALIDTSAAPAVYNVTLADDWSHPGDSRTVNFNTLRVGATVDGSAELDTRMIFYGGNGDDVIKGGQAGNTIHGGPGADTIYAGNGADTFSYTRIPQSIGSSHDIIVGFNATADKIMLPTGVVVNAVDADASGNLGTGTLDDGLTAMLSALQGNHAVQFTAMGGTFDGHVFEVIDTNGITGYQAGIDMVIELQSTINPITAPTSFM